jgi:tRNA-specific 2-thiouridylase
LFATTRAQLECLLFPLGALPKADVRALARKYDLGVADKSDSQDICFVPEGRYSNIVERLKPGAAEPGEIVDLEGRRLGRHRGIINYTIGQRRRQAPGDRRAARKSARARHMAAQCELAG